MKRRILLVAAIIVSLPFCLALAGTSGKIAGTVKDSKTGEAIIGANIIIEGTTYGAAANIDGYFVILNVPPGKYNIIASAVGYTREVLTGVSVSIDLTTTLDIKMASTVISLGEAVTVVAKQAVVQKDLTSSQSRVDAAQIETIPAREVNDVLSMQAGVTVGDNGQIHIRGGRSNEVGYWVNGISVSDGYDGSQAVQVDNSAIQELQVVSGTFNAEYGQAMSGIVNIVTKDGDQTFRGGLSVYSGSYVTSDPMYFGIAKKVSPMSTKDIEGDLSGPIIPGVSQITFYVSGRYYKTDGWLYGDKTFNPDGSAAPGTDTLRDASGNMINIIKPDNPVPMNGRERYSGQAKLTFQFTPLMKLSLSGVGSQQTYHDYNHAYRLDPDGDVTKYDNGFDGSVLWTHTLDETSFYTANLSIFKRQYKEYLYSNPFDPRYNLDPTAFNTGLYEFLHAGTNLHHFTRSTQTQDLKIDYTNQVSELHQIKIGLEGKRDNLNLEDYSVTPLADTAVINGVQQVGYLATIPPTSSPLFQEYNVSPISLSAYAQDKLEYKSMIVNIGIRYDYFDSKGEYPADPQDPNVYLPQKPQNQGLTLEQRLATWYKKATAKYSVSPRFGISYPITDRGVLHFSYGHFLQVPSYQYLYQNPGFKVDAVNPLQGVYGNPDLKPQITVMYEFGLQQQMTDDLSFDVTGFYKDTRDWVGTSPAIPVRDSSGLTATTYYTMFINKDYANARGVTVTLDKRLSDYWSFNLSYTYQVVEGLNSNPDEAQAALLANNQPTQILVPLDWDQRHTLNATLGFGQSDWGTSLLARFGSGLPYSPVVNQADPRGVDVALAVQKNSRRRPDSFNLDLRAYKDFELGFLKCSVFLRVFNLLDTRNEVYVYGQTGRATATPEQLGVGSGITGINRVNTVDEYIIRPDFYSEPRQVQLGLDVNF